MTPSWCKVIAAEHRRRRRLRYGQRAGRKAIAVLLAATTALVPAGAGHARTEERASAPPTTSGPLIGNPTDPSCGTHRIKARGPGERSVTRAVLRSCRWSFAYAPALETDAARDYFAIWTQVEVDPRPGFCVDRITLTRSILNAEITGIAPRGIAHAPSDVSLRVDAEGHSLQDAMIRQDDAVTDGSLQGSAGSHSTRYVWDGLSERVVLLAVGLEFAQQPEDSVVTEHFGSEAVVLRSCG